MSKSYVFIFLCNLILYNKTNANYKFNMILYFKYLEFVIILKHVQKTNQKHKGISHF